MKKLIVLVLLLVLCAAVATVYATQNTPAKGPARPSHVKIDTRPKPQQSQHKMSKPARLTISDLDISAPIIEVGLTTNGDMDTPADITSLGWYKNGAIPGNPGMAVLAGHTGKPDEPTKFRNLETVVRGDNIAVTDIDNKHAAFEVIEVARYSPEAAPRARIFGSSTTARLTLITCTGTWMPSQQTYSERLVIYTVRKL